MSQPWFMSFSGAPTNMPETLAQAGPAATTAFESLAPIAFACDDLQRDGSRVDQRHCGHHGT